MADNTNGNTQTDQNKAADEAAAKAKAADEARLKAEDAKLSPEERDARAKEREAAQAKSDVQAERLRERGDVEPDTVASANMLGNIHVDGAMSAGDHLAQKFGNDPANPKPARHVPPDYDGPTVRLYMKSPDKLDGERVTDVHPDMEGDYLRAGWSR